MTIPRAICSRCLLEGFLRCHPQSDRLSIQHQTSFPTQSGCEVGSYFNETDLGRPDRVVLLPSMDNIREPETVHRLAIIYKSLIPSWRQVPRMMMTGFALFLGEFRTAKGEVWEPGEFDDVFIGPDFYDIRDFYRKADEKPAYSAHAAGVDRLEHLAAYAAIKWPPLFRQVYA